MSSVRELYILKLMLFKISWRNIWRSRTRSMVVMGAIILGVWAVMFMISFSVGLVKSYINNAIEHEISHIQIHQPEFVEDKELKYTLENGTTELEKLQNLAGVQAATVRTIVNGMLSSSKGARGIQIKGVQPNTEAATTKLDTKIVEGDYLNGKKKNAILISRRLADKLKLKLRKKVVLTFQDFDREITAGAFRISGIFETGNTPFDEGHVFVQQSDLNRLLGKENVAHELAVFLEDPSTLDQTTASLQQLFPHQKIETYREISPDVELYESQINTSAIIFIVIVMLALIFGIINTMLMAVLERYKELGMLMAVGMNKPKIFAMVVIETIMLAVVATPIGFALGYLTVIYFNDKGIDLSAFAQGMQQFGLSEIVYPSMESDMYGVLAISVAITSILASIYPAYKAISLRPVEAIRKL